MNNMRIIFGNKLREIRKANNLSMKELAKKIDVSYVAISAYENGEKSPTFENLVKLCQYFEVSLEYFINPTVDSEAVYQDFETVFYLAKKRKVTAKTLKDLINVISPEKDEEVNQNPQTPQN